MVAEDDELKVLAWLASQDDLGPHSLWDSDVMSAFHWSEARAQETLHVLREGGCITSRTVHLRSGDSLGYLRLTPTGRRRLAEPTAYARRSVILARLRHPLG
jgi:hypothetical protein